MTAAQDIGPPVCPSRPRHPNAFFLYHQGKPTRDAAGGTTKRTEFLKDQGAGWSQLPAEEKEEYFTRAARIREEKHQADMEQYRIEKDAYERRVSQHG